MAALRSTRFVSLRGRSGCCWRHGVAARVCGRARGKMTTMTTTQQQQQQQQQLMRMMEESR